jgi:NADH-quinone oxidoreductase subunit J
MSVETVVFFVCALICIAGAFGVIWSRNPVHSALSLVATLFGIAVLFLNENAQLLAAVQVIVYTGAIVVLILFVIMLLGVDKDEDIYTEPLIGQRTFAAIVGVCLFAIVFGVFIIGGTRVVTGQPNCTDGKIVTAGNAYEPQCNPTDPNLATVSDRPNVNQIGRNLFTNWAFAFEITAALLTIAVVGAVVLAKKATDVQPIPEPEDLGYEDVNDIEADDAAEAGERS